jgi:hypothetical protein
MIAARAIAYICCVCVGVSVAHADVRRASAPRAAGTAPHTAQLRLPGAKIKNIDLIAALGRAWGEGRLRDLVAAFRIKARPVVERGDYTAYLQNRALGIELTFRTADALDVPLREHPSGALVLSNIRLYGPGSSTHTAFKGDLPFGLRFGDTREALIAKFGPPDVDGTFMAVVRWDTERYALFAQMSKAGKLARFGLQLPVVATNRPGFERK